MTLAIYKFIGSSLNNPNKLATIKSKFTASNKNNTKNLPFVYDELYNPDKWIGNMYVDHRHNVDSNSMLDEIGYR